MNYRLDRTYNQVFESVSLGEPKFQITCLGDDGTHTYLGSKT